MGAEERKRAAADEACKYVRPGMVLGLGTGSTVQFALEGIARLHAAGANLQGVPTSTRTEQEARRLGIPLTTLERHPRLDLTLDGADEIDPHLNLIKGGGGALLREKVVAGASRTVVIIADDSKFVPVLGSTFPVPVEVVPFAVPVVRPRLEALGAQVAVRTNEGHWFATDNGNAILDARFLAIDAPLELERTLKAIPGVAEVGLFCGMATRAILGVDGGVKTLKPPAGRRDATAESPSARRVNKPL